jgi:hypothetical protein
MSVLDFSTIEPIDYGLVLANSAAFWWLADSLPTADISLSVGIAAAGGVAVVLNEAVRPTGFRGGS